MSTVEAAKDSPDEEQWNEHAEGLYEHGEISAFEASLMSSTIPLLPNIVPEPEDLVPPAGLRPLSEPAPTETKFRAKPPARTSREKAAADSRPDLKPFPYGTKDAA